jgi:flagellar hook-associated protein 3 FlgL
VTYRGDNGLHSLPVSNSLSIATGVDGASSFMRLQTAQGPKSVFDIVEEFETSLETTASQAVQLKVESASGARLSFDIGRRPEPQSLRIDGPYGSVDLTVDMVSGSMAPMIDAINQTTEQTGVRAQIAQDGNTLLVVGQAGEPFTISAFQTPGVDGAQYTPSSKITAQQMIGQNPVGAPVTLVDADSHLGASIDGLDTAINHLALSRAQIGAYAATAQMQSDMLARQELMIKETISGIEDADLTEVVTQLQSLMVNRDAVRQVFAKVGQQSLFDLIR